MIDNKTIRELTDAELVECYRSGDDASFGFILDRYKTQVYSYIRSLTNGNYALTEDIFQETFIKLVMAIRDNHYFDSGKLYAWLTTAAYRLLIDYYRKDKSCPIDYVGEIFDTAFVEQTDDSIEDIIVREQTIEQTIALIDSLPQDQQAVLRMRIFEDIPFKEIAKQTNVSINTALGRMRYALMNMRRMLSK